MISPPAPSEFLPRDSRVGPASFIKAEQQALAEIIVRMVEAVEPREDHREACTSWFCGRR